MCAKKEPSFRQSVHLASLRNGLFEEAVYRAHNNFRTVILSQNRNLKNVWKCGLYTSQLDSCKEHNARQTLFNHFPLNVPLIVIKNRKNFTKIRKWGDEGRRMPNPDCLHSVVYGSIYRPVYIFVRTSLASSILSEDTLVEIFHTRPNGGDCNL